MTDKDKDGAEMKARSSIQPNGVGRACSQTGCQGTYTNLETRQGRSCSVRCSLLSLSVQGESHNNSGQLFPWNIAFDPAITVQYYTVRFILHQRSMQGSG